MKPKQAADFADRWIEAWNTHDLDQILSIYADDFEMSSPVIKKWGLSQNGKLLGKAVIGGYWRKALQLLPNLRFELLAVWVGVDTITLQYKSTHGGLTAEVFHFNKVGLVDWARAHHVQ